ncbi:LytTR family DNA-binding domain-containing protein [Paenibacillus pabuli]|uniref:LytTR family DNA-binding domain-containing protein n=1 Tax=Paenibacillus pabuli TaxID=1472 RepID=UPI000784949A|nr:LytTR family DNA-binding domain-containing protein [Paenibacillus pabuli]MEC0126590.1 LytTR family DNA-binding domain-containing protein [Paenibacillus pabuli]
MKVIFEKDMAMEKSTAKVVTHPDEKSHWNSIQEAICQFEAKLIVINAKNNRNVQIKLSSVVAIESEDRLCCVRIITGERYLLNKRLKFVEEDLRSSQLVKINNQTIINTRHISEFSSTDHARIKVDLNDGSSYFVSRFYIKNFRGKLS